MRLLIAMMKHETNTFSPVPTPLARFGHGPGPLYGEAAVNAYRGTGSGLGAYLDLAEREGAEIVLPIAAGAPPSRPVEDAAFEHMAGVICEATKRFQISLYSAYSSLPRYFLIDSGSRSKYVGRMASCASCASFLLL